ncbi:MAG TPA: sugar phosphate nucleotidyltransferase [Acidobacteriaceae bacterium]|nr:sugar phosphate nucleotidyltransferase [Acidobacteriaceae bacterium]
MPAPSATEWPPRLAILAGGLATRLRPLTIATPKSLIPVAGEPFLAHQLRHLHNQGLREIVLCCGHLGEQIEAFAGDGRRFGLNLLYSHDGDQPLGTGGAIRAALPLLGPQFLVMYGDSWLSEPIQPVWRAFLAGRKPALMTVFRNRNRWGASNVEFRRGTVIRYDKAHPTPAMFHIDYGLEAVDAAVFESRNRPRFDLSEVWAALADSELLSGYETSERFYEIGSLAGLRETETAIAAGRKPARAATRTVPLPVPGASQRRNNGMKEALL